MFTLNVEGFVLFLNNLPIVVTWLVMLVICFFCILLFLRFFGKAGLYVYTCVAIIAANIQVLKIVDFPFFNDPIALGTVLFASTFLCTDILSEYYNTRSARKNIFIGFSGFLLMTIFIILTMGVKPIDEISAGNNYQWALNTQDNLISIFMPFPTFFIASMIAYFSSQLFDVWIFEKLSFYTNKKFLWFRNNFSTSVSSLIDNSVFSILAWIILNPEPLEFMTVLFTFILGTYLLRIFITLFDTPFIYLAKYFLPKKIDE